MTGKILAEESRTRDTDGISRRSFVIGGAAGLGLIGAGALTLPPLIRRVKADHITTTAEIRRIDLPDGSKATIGPDSALAIAYGKTRRHMDLLAGMAYFEVAHDPSRPFAVTSDSLVATALGTAFDVSNDARFVSVSVAHGEVQVRARETEPSGAEKLAAGQWLTLAPATRRFTRGTRETFQIAAWRSGMIVTENETVAAVVAKIARWQPGHVVVADPGLGARVVSGVFDLSDPVRALDAVVRPFGARVREIGSFLTVISPV